ncbi:hypothetical protein AWB71_05329 [Caballeronia peredens]|nr:hypothetical protein AWB71_05329 [Caballeronia peredens]
MEGPKSNFLNVYANDATQFNAGVVPGVDNEFSAHNKIRNYRARQGHHLDAVMFSVVLVWCFALVVVGTLAIAGLGVANEGHAVGLWFMLPLPAFLLGTAAYILKRMTK